MPPAMSHESLREYIPRVQSRYQRLTDKIARSRLLGPDNACFSPGATRLVSGKAKGSKYYLRGVTAWLWLEESRAAKRFATLEKRCG